MPSKYTPLTYDPEQAAKLPVARPDFRPELSEAGKGIRSFADEMQALGGGAVALGAEALKPIVPDVLEPKLDEATKWGLETYSKNMAEATEGRQAPKVARVEDISSPGDLADWAAYHGTKGLATIASTALGGGIGGAIAKGAVKTGAKKYAQTKLAETVGKKAVEEKAKKTVRRGVAAGALGTAFGMEAGGAFGEQVGEGVAPAEAVLPATSVGLANAALELTPFGLAAKYLGVGGKAMKGIRDIIKEDPSLAKKAAKLAGMVGVGAVGGAAAEGLTEGMQELVGIAGERWAKKEKIFEQLSPEQQSDVLNSMAAGALPGGGIGGAVGPFRGAAAPGVVEGETKAAATPEATAQEAIATGAVEGIPGTPEEVGPAPGKPVAGEPVSPQPGSDAAVEVAEPLPTTEGVTTDAVQNAEAARVGGVVQQPGRPEEVAGEVPADEGGARVPEGRLEEAVAPAEETVVAPETVAEAVPETEIILGGPKGQTPFKSQRGARNAITRKAIAGGTPIELPAGGWGIERAVAKPEPTAVVEAVPLKSETDDRVLSAEERERIYEPVEPDELRRQIRKELGGGWLHKAEASGFLQIHPEAEASGVSGRWDPKTETMHIYTQNMPKGESPMGVVLHEGRHAGMDEMLGDSINAYGNDIIELAKGGNRLARNAQKRARAGVAVHFPQGRTTENAAAYDGVMQQELIAYFVQNARGQDKKTGVFRQIVEHLKAWWAQTDLGKAMKKKGLAPRMSDDMAVALARRAARSALDTQISEGVVEEAPVGGPALASQTSPEAQTAERVVPEGEDRSLFSIPEAINKVFEPAGEYIFGSETNSNERSRFSKFQGWLQDQFNELKTKQEGIAAERGEAIPESQMAYEAETASHGRKADRMFEFQKTFVDAMLKIMNRAGFTMEDVNETTYANHAKEANERGRRTQALNFFQQIREDLGDVTILAAPEKGKSKNLGKEMDKAKKKLWARTEQDNKERQLGTLDLVNRFVPVASKETQDAWREFYEKPSGMTDDKADSIMGKWEGNADMAELLSIFDEMNARVPQWYVDAGMLTQDGAAKWTGAYEHYATLRREGFEDESPGLGRGYAAGKPSAIRAFSTRRAVDTFANSIWKAENAIQKTENNQVAATLAKLVEGNPDPDFWTVHKHDKAPFLDENGFVRFGPTKALDPNRDTVFWKQGQPFIISATHGNQKAESIVRGMNNLDAPKLGPIMRTMRKANRFMAAMNTSLSPEFFFTNLPRDFLTAQYNMGDNEAGKLRKQITKNYLSSAKALRKVLRAKSLGKPIDRGDEWVDWARKFEEEGGRTGWMDVYEDTEQRRKKLETRTKQLRPGVHRQAHNAVQWIEDYNAMAENAMRLATYRSLVESGVPTKRAVSIVKDITVNFNRKGSASSAINALYMFAGAGIQGSARILSALKSPKVRKLVYGTIATSFVVDQMNRAFDEDDEYDKIPDYVKERNLVFMNPAGKGFLTIPAPWGYNTVWAIGQKASEGFSHVQGDLPDWTLGGASADLASTAFNAFMPVGGGTLLQALSPTVFDPVVQIGENKDAFGRALKPEPFPGETKPLSEQYWSSASGFSKKAAEIVNAATGGDDVTEGWGSFSPAWLDAISGQIFGAAGRQVRDVGYELPAAAFGDEEFQLRKTPLARKFVAYPSAAQETALYHDRVSKVLSADKRLRLYEEGPRQDLRRARELRRESAKELRQLRRVKETEKRIRNLRKRLKLAEGRDDEVGVRRWKDLIDREREKFNQTWVRMVSS